MRFFVAIGVLACVLTLWPIDADAICVEPGVKFAPSSSSILPPQPTIYVFVPRWLQGGVLRSPQARLVAREVATSAAYQVFAVTVFAQAGEIAVHYDGTSEHESRPAVAVYQIGKSLPAQAKVLDVKHVASRWTCSSTNLIVLETAGNAIAYRFDWRDGSPPTIAAGPNPALGHASCNAYNAYIDEVREFDLVALFANGSEQRIGAAKVMLDNQRVRLPAELVPDAGIDREVHAFEFQEWMPESEPPPPHVGVSDDDGDEDNDDEVSRLLAALASLIILLAATRFVSHPVDARLSPAGPKCVVNPTDRR